MSARQVAEEIVDDLPSEGGEKCGFAAFLALEIIYYVIGSIVSCYQLDEYRNRKPASIAEEAYDPTINSFNPRQMMAVRRHVRKGAQRKNAAITPWQEITMANAVLQKARSPEACQLCLADTQCAALGDLEE